MAARSAFQVSYWTATIVALVLAALAMVLDAPVEQDLGPEHRLLAVLLPVAICTGLTSAVLFIASSAYLWHRTIHWDDLASSAGRIALLFSSVMLLTAVICERIEFGRWWTWSPRLMLSLVLWMLFVAYSGIRLSIRSTGCRATVGGVYGVAVFLNLPLIYLLVGLMPDGPSTSIASASPMRITSVACGVSIALLVGGLIWRRYRVLQVDRGPGTGSRSRE